MSPTTETEEYLEYAIPSKGMTYRVFKTDPPTVTVTVALGHPNFLDKPQTWLGVKAFFDNIQVPT